jgi:PEGA domain
MRPSVKHAGVALACLVWVGVEAAARAQAAPAGTGQLVISSTPAGAEISVDGKALGKAPVTAKGLLPGDHFVEASWSDGKSTNAMQHVEAGASLSVMMGVPVGSLVVISQPAGADLMIDGKPSGKAPATAADLPAGNHSITARWPNGTSLTNIARVIAGNSSVLMLRMPNPPPGAAPTAPAPPPPAPPPPPPANPPTYTPPPPTYTPPPPTYTPPPPTYTPPATSTTPPTYVPPPANPPPATTAPATTESAPAAATPPPAAPAPPPENPPPAAAPPPSTAPPAATAAPVVATTTSEAPTPVYKKWWLWTIVGVAVVGVAVGVGVGVGVSGGNSRYGIAEF